jgi:hypothetical protein
MPISHTTARPSHPTVWVMIFLSASSEMQLRTFCVDKLKIPQRKVLKDLHVTIYHARRLMSGVSDIVEEIDISVPASELRAMAMAPGGENPRSDINPTTTSVGIRIRRAGGAASPIQLLRSRFLANEDKVMLGVRSPSTARTSAFGARSYQPHLTLLRPGALQNPDLSIFGSQIRAEIGSLIFDRLVVRCRQ